MGHSYSGSFCEAVEAPWETVIPQCLPGTGEKDTPMNYIFPVISKLLSNYRTPQAATGGRSLPEG